MSNGIGKNPLNDISQVYLNQVVEGKKKKDDTYLEPDTEKRQKNNEKARKDMEKMGTSMKNPHFEGTGWEAISKCGDAYNAMFEDAKMGKQSDEKLAALHKQVTSSDQSLPSNQFMLKRVQKEMNRRKKTTQKEELELDENRRAARAAGGYKDDSKKQTDPSKAGFTGVGNMSIDQIRKMSARMDKEKTQKEGLEALGLFSAEEIEEILEKMEYERDMDHPKTTRETKAGDPNQITTREPVKRPSTIKDKKSPKKM